jgi:predicted P-loop ATPase
VVGLGPPWSPLVPRVCPHFHAAKFDVSEIIKLPVPSSSAKSAKEHADAETERDKQLFNWADGVLKAIGKAKAIAAARSTQELKAIPLDLNSAEVVLAIRNALHPANGKRQEHFLGLKEGGLKLILKDRFEDLKKDRARELQGKRRQQPDWTEDLLRDKSGKPISILWNLMLILRHAPKWKGVIGFDEFSMRVVIRKRPPWGEERPDAPWTDHHESLTRAWFQSSYRLKPGMGDVGRSVQTVARENKFHPVRDYFESLAWDGVSRLDTWLIDYFHADDTPYIRAIGPRYLISAVARIYDPGEQVDHVLVLEGPQGKKKSETLRTLAVRPTWYTDHLSAIGSKDAALELRGRLIIELGEMDALNRASMSAIKRFLTSRTDNFRPVWGKHTTDVPRQNVFAATINPTTGGYLPDPTGARRFWPVACHGMIDRDGLEAARDQLWAEAVHRYKAREPWWLETPELEALATAEQDTRFVVDAWEEPIREWIGDRLKVKLTDVMKRALGLAVKHQTQPAQKRVKAVLTRMRFTRQRPRTPKGRREYVYQRDPPIKKADGDGRPQGTTGDQKEK